MLCPVNLTLDYGDVSIIARSCVIASPYPFNINSRCAFEYLTTCYYERSQIRIRRRCYLHNRTTPYLIIELAITVVDTIQDICPPLASNTCPDLSVPSGNVNVTISLYLGNLTWQYISNLICHSTIQIYLQTYILQDNQGTIDTADGIVSDSGSNAVRRRLSWISHDCDFWQVMGNSYMARFSSEEASPVVEMWGRGMKGEEVGVAVVRWSCFFWSFRAVSSKSAISDCRTAAV